MGSLLLATAIVSVTSAPGFSSADVAEANHAVEREFRYYRIAVYNTYRQHRPEYDHRIRVGREMFQAWKDAGGQPHQRHALVGWFALAKSASLPSVNGPLPPAPAFALAIAPSREPEVELASQQQPSSRRRYHVRRVEPTSTVALQPADNRRRKRAGKSTWQSVSQALYSGMTLGASRAVPTP